VPPGADEKTDDYAGEPALPEKKHAVEEKNGDYVDELVLREKKHAVGEKNGDYVDELVLREKLYEEKKHAVGEKNGGQKPEKSEKNITLRTVRQPNRPLRAGTILSCHYIYLDQNAVDAVSYIFSVKIDNH
jgi:hypothetical protein